MSKFVLDASALLELLSQEPGAERWAAALNDAAISAINLSEVVAKLAESGMREVEIRGALEPLGIDVVTFDAALAYRAGLLRAQTKRLGFSLGDRACLALGLQMKLPVLTADRSWMKLQVGGGDSGDSLDAGVW